MTSPGQAHRQRSRRRGDLYVVEQIETPSDFLDYYRRVLLPAQRVMRRVAYVCIVLGAVASVLALICALHSGWHLRAVVGFSAGVLSLVVPVLMVVMLNRQRVVFRLLERLASVAEGVGRSGR